MQTHLLCFGIQVVFNKFSDHCYTERYGAHHIGLAKIIPPPEWKPRAAGYGDTIGNIKKIQQQHQKFLKTDCDGVFELRPTYKHSYMTFNKFKEICQLPKNAPPKNID